MTTTTEMQLVDINKLIPYVNNARTHSPEQITKLRSSLREFGFVNPIIVDKDFNVLAGHGRLAAAKAEGITEVPCVFAEHLTEAQKKAYIINDNRSALDAGWDDELLKVEMEALQDMGFDLSMTGFDESELADLFGEEKDTEDDDFDVDQALEGEVFVQPGDIWLLGKHRLRYKTTSGLIPKSFTRFCSMHLRTSMTTPLTAVHFIVFIPMRKSVTFTMLPSTQDFIIRQRVSG